MRKESPARWAPVATGARFVAAATAQRKARDTRESRLSLSREKPIEKGASAHFSIDTAGAGAAAPAAHRAGDSSFMPPPTADGL